MKIVLTGATGFVGSHVLAHLVAQPNVSAVTCLVRKPVEPTSPKVTILHHHDFLSYDAALLDRLADHDACIWTLGGKASDLRDPQTFARVTHGFTLAFAEGIVARLGRPFTLCYLSGMGADPTETARLPWERLTRHIKGRTEKDLQTLQERWPLFTAHAFRPGGILPDDASRLLRLSLAPILVSVGGLAEALIAGAADERLARLWPVVGNAAIKRMAKGRPAHS